MSDEYYPLIITKWASSWDYDTYHIGDQRRLRQDCVFAQTWQSLRCLHTWSMEEDEGSGQKSGIQPHRMAAHACLKNEFMETKKCHNLMRWLRYPHLFFWVSSEAWETKKQTWWVFDDNLGIIFVTSPKNRIVLWVFILLFYTFWNFYFSLGEEFEHLISIYMLR